ncbi:Ig-like domain-containing protein [Companilactobacillus mishanensis]|uniref:BIG2 domain-containing protein n=1 Tax=Companilactobacillus mishanensis TaxID=2486008 RepID=A0A5P0ZFM1_9LACO|nr:Ig-like domain-containing protein [Companilactobacillus mishanensis]MQS51789.1 hypothetical protein [Companilactobacillus mishanensis]
MNGKKKKYFLLILMLGAFLSIYKHDAIKRPNIVYADEVSVTPKHRPSSKPDKLFFLWLTSGYNLQPKSEYTYPYNAKTLYTDSGLSIFSRAANLLATPHYTWFKSEDEGRSWQTLVDGKDAKKELTITPNEVGTVYYQQKVMWYTFSTFLDIPEVDWSKVASITTLSDAVPAESIEVTSDDDYLYSNQDQADTTSVHAKVVPTNATGDMTWLVDDPSLATVDPKTGLVTSNNKSRSGVVKVMGYMQNPDGTSVGNYVKIRVGGGLEDQTGFVGKTATFKIQGNEATTGLITWKRFYKDNKGKEHSEDLPTESENSSTYVTKPLTIDNNGDEYQATITIKSAQLVKKINTNRAKLTVVPYVDTKPKFTIRNEITNSTFDDHNEDNSKINKVSEGDRIDIKGTLNEENPDSVLSKGNLKFEIPANAELNDVRIGTQKVTNYSIINDSKSADKQIVSIPELYFLTGKPINYDVSFFAGKYAMSDFQTTPEVTGFDSQGQELPGKFTGNTLSMNFSKNAMSVIPSNIDYGIHQSFPTVGIPINAKVANNKSEVLTIDDERRSQDNIKVKLTQVVPFTSGSKILPANIRYYWSNGNSSTIDTNGTIIRDTKNGEKLHSIISDSNEGLRLFFNKSSLLAGKYTTRLEWSFVNSI